MPSNDYLGFRIADHYGKPVLNRQIEPNLKSWLDWAFLNIGAWQEVKVENSGVFGETMHILQEVDEPGFNDNTVYQSIRKDWCYETGVRYNTDPLDITKVFYSGSNTHIEFDSAVYFNSGNEIQVGDNASYNGDYTVNQQVNSTIVELSATTNNGDVAGGIATGVYSPMLPTIYVDGTPRATGDSGYEHWIDYPQGRVHFLSAQTDAVTADYSIRNVQVYQSDDFPWWVEIQKDTFDTDNIQWSQNLNSGDFAIHSQHRIQLPAIVTEFFRNTSPTPFQLGSLTQVKRPTYRINVITENKNERDNILDILDLQEDKTIWMYDLAEVISSGVNPLDSRGMVNSAGLMYHDLVDENSYRWRKLRFDNVVVSTVEVENPKLYIGKIDCTFEVII